MNVRKSFLLWFVSIVGLHHILQCDANYFNYSTFRNITIALHENVRFMAKRLEQVNIDAAFGLTLAQVNLAAVLSSPNIKFIFENDWNRLVETQYLCDTSRIYTVNKLIQTKNKSSDAFVNLLMRPEIWVGKILWRENVLRPVFIASSESTIPDVEALIFSGTPQELESDFCLEQLINDNCKISDACIDMLNRNDGSRGYPLTHRLLFVKIALSINCEKYLQTNVSLLIEDYCREILQDLIDLENANFPSISRDLAMEQIVLCGMEGYSEFTHERYGNFITSWQNIYGCYSALNVNKKIMKVRNKKSTNLMDYGCDSHACGVAAAALSLLIREYIENRVTLITKKNIYK